MIELTGGCNGNTKMQNRKKENKKKKDKKKGKTGSSLLGTGSGLDLGICTDSCVFSHFLSILVTSSMGLFFISYLSSAPGDMVRVYLHSCIVLLPPQ